MKVLVPYNNRCHWIVGELIYLSHGIAHVIFEGGGYIFKVPLENLEPCND